MSNHQIRLAGPWTLRVFRNCERIATHMQSIDRMDVREIPWDNLELTRRFNWVSEETNVQIRLTFQSSSNRGSLAVNGFPLPLRSRVMDRQLYQIESVPFEQHLRLGQNQMTLAFVRTEFPSSEPMEPEFFVSIPVLEISPKESGTT